MTLSLYFRPSGLDKGVVRIIRHLAKKSDRSLSSYVRQIFIEHIEKINAEKKS